VSKTAKDLTQEDLAQYKESYRQKKIQQEQVLQKKYEDAWKVAREAARILHTSFQAKKVMVFGSLIDRSRFNRWSDIDLAGWGIPDELYFRAYGAMIDFNPRFKIDLVDPDECSPLLREIILREGIEII